jgi:NADPH:quinone reductase-like Zn-dependent oxidoreductase
MFHFKEETQGEILSLVARLIDEGKIKTTLNKELKGMTPANLKMAHEILESGQSVGKIVISFE